MQICVFQLEINETFCDFQTLCYNSNDVLVFILRFRFDLIIKHVNWAALDFLLIYVTNQFALLSHDSIAIRITTFQTYH